MYNLIGHGNNYSKTSETLLQYYRDESALNNTDDIIDFLNDTDSTSFKFKLKVTGQTRIDGTNDAEIMMPLIYLSNFWRALEMPLINCKINLLLTWLKNCFIMAGAIDNQVSTFRINDTKLYFSPVTLSTNDNAK